MPLNYNFAFKNSKLKRWERIVPASFLKSDASTKSKLIYLYKILSSNPHLIYPPAFVLIITLAIQLITIYPTRIVNRLEGDHKQYLRTTQEISKLKSSINTMKKHLSNIRVFYSQATPSYLFAFYLQNTVPQGIQLNNYFVSDNGFDITASSYEIETLNDMVTLLLESPIIKKDSLIIKKINREEGIRSSNSNLNSNVILEIKGEILKLSLEKREILYRESLAEGLLKKLLRFNTLERLIKS
tara:strand:+ start:3893 stop:4618 length:726 start_codon:yes stop_codon:yes gene_type:complete